MPLAAAAARIAGAPRPSRRELAWLVGAMALAVAIRLAFVYLTRGHALAGDEIEYDTEARLAADGNWFWTKCCFGVPHESLQKAPGYPAFVSTGYTVLGTEADRVLAVQALLAPITVGLAWLLGRRWFTPAVGIVAAFVAAVAPNVWQYDVRLYSESLATPLTLLVLLLVIERRPESWRWAALVGVAIAANLYVRPSAILLFAVTGVAWWVTAGFRRAALSLGVAVLTAALLIAPWTLRNRSVEPDHFVLISIQDAGLHGTFNSESAADEEQPWKWRPVPIPYRDVFAGPPLSDGELAEELRSRAFDFIRDNPDSLPKAFFWNGITRVWDVRRPGHAIDAAPFEGRPRGLATVAYITYWLMVPLALWTLWRERRRLGLVLPLLTAAFALSAIYSADGGTRYRAPVEPVIAILAAASVVRSIRLHQSRGSSSSLPRQPSSSPSQPEPPAHAR